MRRRAFLKGVAGLVASAAVPLWLPPKKEVKHPKVIDLNPKPMEFRKLDVTYGVDLASDESFSKLTAGDIEELVTSTMRELNRVHFEQIASNLQDYEVFSKWFKRDQDQIRFNVYQHFGVPPHIMNPRAIIKNTSV